MGRLQLQTAIILTKAPTVQVFISSAICLQHKRIYSMFVPDYHQIPRVRPNSRAPISFGRATNTANVGPAIPQCADEKKAAFWEKDAQLTLYKKLVHKLNEGTAKNIILFLGDGMSIPTLAAARTYKGQLNGERGEDSELSFEKFPYVGLSKTFCLDKQVADSACSATA